MKILHVTADFKWTGPAEPMLNAVLGLRALGHEVDLACAAPPPEDPDRQLLNVARERGADPAHLFWPRRGFRPLRDLHEVRRLRETLERGAYDIVHVHHTRDHLLARWAIRDELTRLVASWHHGDPVPPRLWNRWLLGPRGADGLVVLSPRIAEQVAVELGWPADRVAVVPGSIDIERFKPRPPSARVRAELGIPPGSRVIGVVARLQPQRRFDLLLDAFARACSSAPDLRLVVLGRGTRAEAVLHEPVRELGLERVVISAGHRSQDYAEVLSLFDALVYLVPGSDGSCRAVLEAMAMGIPAIVSSRGMLPEIVRNGETGRIVREDPEVLADVLRDVWRDPASWQTFGKAAREAVRIAFTIPYVAGRLEQFYARLL